MTGVAHCRRREAESPEFFILGEVIMIKKAFLTILAASFLSGMTLSLTACNTMEGVGKDVERGGSKIKEEAREHNDRR